MYDSADGTGEKWEWVKDGRNAIIGLCGSVVGRRYRFHAVALSASLQALAVRWTEALKLRAHELDLDVAGARHITGDEGRDSLGRLDLRLLGSWPSREANTDGQTERDTTFRVNLAWASIHGTCEALRPTNYIILCACDACRSSSNLKDELINS